MVVRYGCWPFVSKFEMREVHLRLVRFHLSCIFHLILAFSFEIGVNENVQPRTNFTHFEKVLRISNFETNG